MSLSHLEDGCGIEARLVGVSSIRTLLHFNHLEIIEYLEAVPAGCKENHIASGKDPAVQVRSVIVIEINAEFPLTYQEDLLRVLHLSYHRVVYVRLDAFAGGVRHECQLL